MRWRGFYCSTHQQSGAFNEPSPQNLSRFWCLTATWSMRNQWVNSRRWSNAVTWEHGFARYATKDCTFCEVPVMPQWMANRRLQPAAAGAIMSRRS